MRRGFAAVLALACVAGCARPGPTSGMPGQLSVEVLRGFEPEQIVAREREGPVAVLVDSTRSMGRREAGGSLGVGARRAAKRFVQKLPASEPVWLYALGGGAGDACQPSRRIARLGRGENREPLLTELLALRAGGEGGLAEGLARLRSDLGANRGLAGSRVVVFSDLARDCGGDVCAAAQKLVEGGARLDVVVLGDGRVPACLSETSGLAAIAPPTADTARRIHYCLELNDPDPVVVGCSVVGGLAVAAPSGRATVVVDLEPPLRVDAYFAPGRAHVLQVLDFPALDPPTRHWRWQGSPLEPGDQ